MPPSKPNTARRREVRRNVRRQPANWREAVRQPHVAWAIAFACLLTVVGSALALVGNRTPRYHVGQVLQHAVVPKVDFESIDTRRTDIARQIARDQQPPVFVANLEYADALRDSLIKIVQQINENPNQAHTGNAKHLLTPELIASIAERYIDQGQVSDSWYQLTREYTQAIFDRAIVLSVDDYEFYKAEDRRQLVRVHPNPSEGQPQERLHYAGSWLQVPLSGATEGNRWVEALRQNFSSLTLNVRFPPDLRELVISVVMDVPWQPTYLLDGVETRRRADAAAANVAPTMSAFAAGQVLRPAGTRLALGDVQLLNAAHDAYLDQRPWAQRWLSLLGLTGMIGLIAAGLWLYCAQYNKRATHNPWRGFAIASLILLGQGSAVAAALIWPSFLYGAITFPVVFAAMTLAIAYNRRFALAASAVLALLIAVSLNLGTAPVVVMLTAAVATVLQLNQVRSSSKLVLTGIWSGLATAAAAALALLAHRDLFAFGASPVRETLRLVQDGPLHTFAAAFATGLLVQGLLPLVARVFNITTAMMLRELNDASHPLLQRLAQSAPGTYQHSLRIADMAEAAADAIGADGLLCRVGAMYHDVGKINKPHYFIENQGGGPNKHAKLSPAMSLLIIVGHVKDGSEMAREFGLPPVLRHFIESHHGTTLVEFFFHAAKKKAEATPDPADAPSEFEFRYPGPKPQTKEAAIMLLCDSLEAAARTLPEPTPVRLEQLVHTIANKRLLDGQFDDCELTLRDLAQIEASITKTLCAVYHARIKYPSDKPIVTPEESSAPPAAASA
ncbi:MAG: HDIG domain-containing metalloprotein [Planctomycetota bacterium]